MAYRLIQDIKDFAAVNLSQGSQNAFGCRAFNNEFFHSSTPSAPQKQKKAGIPPSGSIRPGFQRQCVNRNAIRDLLSTLLQPCPYTTPSQGPAQEQDILGQKYV
jgi:hypothetical protein